MKAGYKYYAFISYKHEDDKGLFKEDAAWAEALDDELRFLHIPVEISREELIRETDDSVNPVFRDDTNLPMTKEGELQKALKRKLKSSKTLVLILSRSMVQDQNKKYSRDKEKNEAWVYWEVMTFLEHHNYDWGRIIPVFIEKERYLPSSIGTSINMEKKYSNIQKPWQDYGTKYDWDNDRQSFYRRVACDVASAIFHVDDKEAFWNVKEKAREAEEAERKENEAQLQLRDMKLKKNRAQMFILALGVIAAVLVGAFIYSRSRRVQSMELTAKGWSVLESGSRRDALDYARAAHRKWRGNPETKQLMWVAGDSTMAYMSVNSPVSFSNNDSLFAYIDRNRYVVIMDSKTFQEVDRIDAGKAFAAQISPTGDRVAIHYVGDNGFHQGSIYDRNDHTSKASFDVDTNTGKWNESGSIYLTNNHIAFSSGSDYHLVARNGNWLSTVEYTDASFMGTDSLLAIVFSNFGNIHYSIGGKDSLHDVDSYYDTKQGLTSCRLFLYDMKVGKPEGDRINLPTELPLPDGVTSAALSPHDRFVVASTCDSIYTFRIEASGGGFTLNRKHAEKLDAKLKYIDFIHWADSAFVVDEHETGHFYDVTGRRSPALAYSYIGDIRSLSKEYKAICGTIDGEALYYLKDSHGINLSDGKFTGFHLPLTGRKVDGSCHSGVYSIQVTDSGNEAQKGCKTYLYTIGVGRTVAPQNTLRMLSSDYVVRSGWDLFISESEDGRSSSIHSSACLYNPITGEHIMHLAQKEDAEPWKSPTVVFNNYYLNGNSLVALCKNGDNDNILRVYDLKDRTLTYEIHIGHNGSFINWFNDGSFLYTDGTVLYRIKANAEAEPVFVSGCYDLNYHYWKKFDKTGNRLIFGEKMYGETRTCWVGSADGIVHRLDGNGLLSPDGNILVQAGDLYTWHRLDNGEGESQSESKLTVLDSRSLDTLSQVVSYEHTITKFNHFSSDSKYLIYAEGDQTLCCIAIPSGKELWRKNIWRPMSVTTGKKYLVIQSTSLLVLDIRTGKTVCDFETGLTEMKLTLSPDENWLIAGDKLYSIPLKQQMASDIKQGFTHLENDYIVYSRHLMKLPSAANLFD